MKVLLLANANVGVEIAQYLAARPAVELVGLGIHEEKLRRQGDELIGAAKVPTDRIFEGTKLRDLNFLETIRSWKPDLVVCAFWAYILKKDFLDIAPKGTINFHPGYLPTCRGKNPNVWPFVDGTPSGVTIHYADEGVDTGDIIARAKVPILSTDTAGTLYDRTCVEIVKLFKECWPGVERGTNERIPQSALPETPTFHLGKEVDPLDEIDLDKSYNARELIQRLRARSYGHRSFAYYMEGDKKVRIGVFLAEEN